MSRPTYAELGDACATAHAMELIGARWTYPVMRELMLGPKRFGELLDAVRGYTPAVLSSRLRELSTAGLIESTHESSPDGALAYDLTAWARELAPILRQLGRWAQSSPVRISTGGLTPDAAAQAMITMGGGDPSAAQPVVQLHLVDERVTAGGDHAYVVRWTRAGLTAHRGHHRVRVRHRPRRLQHVEPHPVRGPSPRPQRHDHHRRPIDSRHARRHLPRRPADVARWPPGTPPSDNSPDPPRPGRPQPHQTFLTPPPGGRTCSS